jgi:hypothetical protein
LKNLIDNKTIYGGDGILKGTPKPKPFSFLIGMPIVENEEINQYYTRVDKEKILSKKDVFLESGRRKELFEGEHIYLKGQTLNESDIVVSYCKDNAVNRHDVITITSKKATDNLKKIYSFLLSNIHTYFQFLSTSAWGVSTRPAIKIKEYLSFPYIEPNKKIKDELVNLVNRFLEKLIKHHKEFTLGEPKLDKAELLRINKIIYALYGITDYEKDMIDYLLNVSRYQFQETKYDLFTERVDNNFKYLGRYADVYIHELEKIYTDEFIKIEIYPLNHFIAMNFIFLNKKPEQKIVYSQKMDIISVFKKMANNLSVSKITNITDPKENLYIQKDIKGFESNSFYIIKPNEYKCWHRAIAWYDVAEFKEAIQKAELKRLNGSISNG